ncbi:MAG: right-handed parallel beta-helix repeat-containing protein [Myxococcota bacterium]
MCIETALGRNPGEPMQQAAHKTLLLAAITLPICTKRHTQGPRAPLSLVWITCALFFTVFDAQVAVAQDIRTACTQEPPSGTVFHVSVDGQANGDGSASSPWDLATALSHPATLRPGDTLWLHGGRYGGIFTSRITGVSGKPITVRSAPGEWAILDAMGASNISLFVSGAYAIYRDIEVTDSQVKGPSGTGIVVTKTSDSDPGGGRHTKFINLVVHDVGGQGFGFWTPAENSEIYGSVIYYNGRNTNQDHGIYTQNLVGTKRIVDNVLVGNYSFGLHVYGSSTSYLVGYHIEGNIAVGNGNLSNTGAQILVGGSSPAEDIVLLNNYTYHSRVGTNVMLGYSKSATNRNLEAWGTISSADAQRCDSTVGNQPLFRK